MKILVIGGTGHVGSFLVPKLLKNGHDVYVGTRGGTKLRDETTFNGAKFITVNSSEVESLTVLRKERFDVVIEFPGSAKLVWDVLADTVSHFIACGSLWMFGYPKIVPTPEISFEKCFVKSYERRFDEIQIMLLESGNGKAVFTAIMPPNICGPGKIPLDQYGGRDIAFHKQMALGETVYIPDGPECLIGPCDAEDIAELFFLAVENRVASAGQIFNVGSEYSLTTSEFIRAYARIYGVEIPIEKISWERYINEINTSKVAWWHLYAPMLPDLGKAKKLLGYRPRYTPEETMKRAVDWMKQEGLL
ncbi:MAG: NAD(P)-dependent oxidoreductase [Clostridia bacterium]|nr:NAD(P)-dependent oxidoreductase [Clostridia bacterium]